MVLCIHIYYLLIIWCNIGGFYVLVMAIETMAQVCARGVQELGPFISFGIE